MLWLGRKLSCWQASHRISKQVLTRSRWHQAQHQPEYWESQAGGVEGGGRAVAGLWQALGSGVLHWWPGTSS